MSYCAGSSNLKSAKLHQPQTRMSYGNWSFFINGPAVQDSVPAYLWSLNIPLDIFKEKLKTESSFSPELSIRCTFVALANFCTIQITLYYYAPPLIGGT